MNSSSTLPAGPSGFYAPQPRTEPAPSSALTVALFVLAAAILPVALACALALTREQQVVAAVLGLLGILLIIARPFWGLVFFVGLLYTRPEEAIPALSGMRLTLVISLVTFAGMFLQLALHREPLIRNPVNLMILGFGTTAVLSTIAHGNTTEAATEIGKLVVLVLLILNLVRTPQRYAQLVTALIVFTAYLSLYSIYLYFTGRAFVQHGLERSMATGIFGDPNDLAATIVAGLALAASRMARSRIAGRILYGAVLLIFLWAILLTNSRGGMIALLVLAVAFFVTSFRNKLVGLAIAAVVGGALYVVAPARMREFDRTEASANSRFWFWSNAVQLLTENPLGVGYERFADVNYGAVAHNSFVQCFAELGLPGYFFWMGCLYYCYRRRSRSEGDHEETRIEAADLRGSRLALTGFLAAGFFLTRTYVPVLYLLITLPIVAQVSTSPRPERAWKLPPGAVLADWGRIALLCVGSILFIKFFADWMR